MGLTKLLEQVEVLHIARADLDHVGELADDADLPRVHDLSYDRHRVIVADLAEDAKTFDAGSLKAVRARTWLERAAAKDVCPGRPHAIGNGGKSFVTLDGAGAGNHCQRSAANLHHPDLHHRVFGVQLAAGELERLHDRKHLLDPRDRAED